MEDQVSEVERAIRALYGTKPLLERGVVHVTAVVAAAGGGLCVIKIGEHAPKSETDFFVLNLCRARADAILTTAKNLRAEPALTHALQGRSAASLGAYREQVLGKRAPPLCVVLTRAGDLPLDHAFWTDGTEKLVLTLPESAGELGECLRGRAEVLGVEQLDARTACALLEQRGHALVSVETGPSAASLLYEAPSRVDELLLSIYEGALLPEALGGALPNARVLTAGRVCASDVALEEESGRWRFQRWL